jgi:putative membrane protein
MAAVGANDATPNAQTPLSASDKDFMAKALQGSTLEVTLGHDATAKTTSPDVKNFATHMITDHGKARDELKQLAVKRNVDIPVDLDEDHRAVVDRLAKLNGPEFDKAYAKTMVDDHEKDIREFRDAQKKVADPELKAWVNKTLPVLESHLAMANEMKSKLMK